MTLATRNIHRVCESNVVESSLRLETRGDWRLVWAGALYCVVRFDIVGDARLQVPTTCMMLVE